MLAARSLARAETAYKAGAGTRTHGVVWSAVALESSLGSHALSTKQGPTVRVGVRQTAAAHLGLGVQLASHAAGVLAVLSCQMLHPADAVSHTSSCLLNTGSQLLLQLLGGLLGCSAHSLRSQSAHSARAEPISTARCSSPCYPLLPWRHMLVAIGSESLPHAHNCSADFPALPCMADMFSPSGC